METGRARELTTAMTADWRAPVQVSIGQHGDTLAVAGGGHAEAGTRSIVFQGRIHWVDGAVAGMTGAEIAKRLLECHARSGEDFLGRVKGSFVLAIMDPEAGYVLLALDRIGQHACYYTLSGEGIVFASGLRDLLRHPAVEPEISSQAVFDYVYYHHCPSPGTIYEDVFKLEGGQYLRFQRGTWSKEYYWKPDFSERLEQPEQAAQEELLSLLKDAVQRDAGDPSRTGSFLSGGLDSSTVSGLLSTVHPGSCNTFSIGFPVKGYDETEYARAAASHFATRHHEFILQPEHALNAVLEIAGYYDEPFGNSSALPALYCARLAVENGVDRMLAGDGGDELFAGNERYQRQLLFERYERVPSVGRTLLEGALSMLPAVVKNRGILHKANRYVEQAKVPLPDRLQDYNFLHRHRAETVFDAGFLEAVDPMEPIGLLRTAYGRPERADALNRMLYMDWKTTLHDNDLVKVNRMCELAGVEVVYPMLDDDVIDFSTTIPSAIKMKDGRLRGFYKDAVRSFLPAKIIDKSKHGFGLPFGIWLSDYSPLRELAYDSIEALKKRRFFRPEFLDHAVEMHRSVHAAYYGELIWILMMLELWIGGRNTNQ